MHCLEAGGWQTLGGYISLAHRRPDKDQSGALWGTVSRATAAVVRVILTILPGCSGIAPGFLCSSLLIKLTNFSGSLVFWIFSFEKRIGYSSLHFPPKIMPAFFSPPNLSMWFHSGNNPFVGYCKYLLPVCDFPFYSLNCAILMQTYHFLSIWQLRSFWFTFNARVSYGNHMPWMNILWTIKFNIFLHQLFLAVLPYVFELLSVVLRL